MLQILTIRASFGARCLSAACVNKNVPRPFRFTSWSQCSSVCSSKGRLTASPALLITMSMCPYFATVESMRDWGPAIVERSASTARPGVGRLATRVLARSIRVGVG